MDSSRMSLPLNGGRGAGLQDRELRQAPVYRRLAVGLQIAVDPRKMSATEKSAMRRERGRMRAFQNQVFPGIDEGALFLRVAAPEHEYQALAFPVEQFDDGVGELLPALVLMAAGFPGLHGECCIEQEHALFSPMDEMTMIRRFDPQIVFQFDEDILETGRDFHPRPHRKAKAVRLVRAMVG